MTLAQLRYAITIANAKSMNQAARTLFISQPSLSAAIHLCSQCFCRDGETVRDGLEDLEEYPCLSFDQGSYNSFYFAEEVLSTYEYKRLIKANDRATFLNLMVGLDGYTLCSGIICEELNGTE